MVSQARSDVALLYRRAGFGLKPEELDAASSAGYEAAVEAVMGGLGRAPDPGGDALAPPVFEAGPPPRGHDPVAAKAHAVAVSRDLVLLQQWWMDRMIATSTPLREKLTLFWHGHFATGAAKVRDARLMYMQNQLFRESGGAGFEPLVQAVAKDGAMMLWLDISTDKKAHPNENFAREMMELFTLGVGNYTQADVTAGSRGFTGWVYDRQHYRYRFIPSQHDYGTKTYLGQTGDWNGNDIVHIAVTRRESARFVLSKLWSHFAYPVTPADGVVDDLVQGYGPAMDLSAAVRAVFLHPAFRGPTSRTGLVKQPAEYLAGAARALGVGSGLSRGGRTLPAFSTALGQTLFNPPNVGGWGQNGYWLDTATAQVRFEAAAALAEAGDISAVTSVPESQRVAATADLLGLEGWGPTTAAALSLLAARPRQLVALALTAPEYVLA